MRSKDLDMCRKITERIERRRAADGGCPSLQELADSLGVAKSTASRYVAYMKENGMLSGEGRRNIVTPSGSAATVSVPLLGQVACGLPNIADGNVDSRYSLPVAIFGSGEMYMLRARGDSMIEAGIDDGDMIIVDADKEPAIGDKVVALDQDNESTLKTLRYDEKSARYYLHPENHLLEDIYVDELTVQGVVRFIIKKG